MCEIFGITSHDDFYLNEYLKTFYSHSDKHPHGWGLAKIMRDEVSIEKEPVQASKSNYLKERLREPLEAKMLFAHIRYATIGNVEYRNCHPYSGKDNHSRRWTLIHNGTIFEYEPLHGYVNKQKGDTDSERIFLYIIDKINEAQTEKKGKLTFEERFKLIDSIVVDMAKGNKLNLILTDGHYIYVHTNCKNTLHYLEKNGAAIFSTQPLSDEDWKEVPFMTLLAYKRGKLAATGTTHNNEYEENEEQLKLLYQIFSNL